jgi:hypothetical protein
VNCSGISPTLKNCNGTYPNNPKPIGVICPSCFLPARALRCASSPGWLSKFLRADVLCRCVKLQPGEGGKGVALGRANHDPIHPIPGTSRTDQKAPPIFVFVGNPDWSLARRAVRGKRRRSRVNQCTASDSDMNGNAQCAAGRVRH